MKCKETEKLLVIKLSRNKRVGFDKKASIVTEQNLVIL